MVMRNRWNGGHVCSGTENNVGVADTANTVNTVYSRVISPRNGAARLAAYGAETCNTPVRVLGCAYENIVIPPPPRLVRQRAEWCTRNPRVEFMVSHIIEQWQREWTMNQD